MIANQRKKKNPRLRQNLFLGVYLRSSAVLQQLLHSLSLLLHRLFLTRQLLLHQLKIFHEKKNTDVRLLFFYLSLEQQRQLHSRSPWLLLSLQSLEVFKVKKRRKSTVLFYLFLGRQQLLHWLFLWLHRLFLTLLLLLHQLNMSSEEFRKFHKYNILPFS